MEKKNQMQENELELLKKVNQVLNVENQVWIMNNQALIMQSQVLKTEIQTLKTGNQVLKTENHVLKTVNQVLKTENQVLKEGITELRKLQNQLQDRLNNTASAVPEWLDVPGMCKLFNLKPRTFRRYYLNGDLTRSQLGKGGKVFYRPADIYASLEKYSETKGGKS